MKKILAMLLFSLMGLVFASSLNEDLKKYVKTFIHKGEYIEINTGFRTYYYPKSAIELYQVYDEDAITIYTQNGKEELELDKWIIKNDDNGNIIIRPKAY